MATKKAVVTAKKTKKVTTSRAATTTKRVATIEPTISPITRINRAPIGALIAEFVGTFAFAGTIIAASGQPIIILFALAAIVLTIGQVSGAHVNPAISIAAFINRQIGWKRALGYVVAQFLGAMLAYAVLNWFFKGTVDASTAALTGQSTQLFHVNPLTAGKEWYAFWAEVLGAIIFGFGVGSVIFTKKSQYATAYTVAGSLFIGLIIGGATAILNPAVAVAIGAFDFSKGAVWPIAVWGLATVIGMTAGMGLFRLIKPATTRVAE